MQAAGFSPSPSITEPSSRKAIVDETAQLSGAEEQSAKDHQQGLSRVNVPGPTGQFAGLAALAVVGPVLILPVVSDFVGRMAVAMVFGLVIAALKRKMTSSG